MTERWLPIARVEGRYEVSDHGRIRCVRPAKQGRSSGAVRKPVPCTRGYLRVQVHHNARVVDLGIAPEVLAAFVGPRPPGQEARHLDGNKTDNRLSNLAWGTPLENAADKQRHGTMARGERHGQWRGGVTFWRHNADAVVAVLREMGIDEAVRERVAKRLGVVKP
jgi:hypothetical protein